MTQNWWHSLLALNLSTIPHAHARTHAGEQIITILLLCSKTRASKSAWIRYILFSFSVMYILANILTAFNIIIFNDCFLYGGYLA
jgi:hypothetical protein